MPSKSKIKGSTWERAVAKFLGEEFGEEFMRVQNSGAFLGGMNFNRRQTMGKHHIAASKGDISAPESMPRFNCECKNYAEIAFHQIISGSCKQLDLWIKQTEETANPGDVNFTIFKITRAGSWIVFEARYDLHLDVDSYVKYGDYIVCDFESFIKSHVDQIKKICS